MSSAPAQLAVASTASTHVASAPQMQKDFLEESLARQNSIGNRVRGSIKGKHLTRSHAMRESTSPPRTPTPRSEHLAISPVSFSSTETISDSKLHVQSSSLSTSPSIENQTVLTSISSQHPQQQNSSTIMYSSNENNGNCGGSGGVVCNQNQLDVDFPKLSPPKSSKCSRNTNNMNRELGDKVLTVVDQNKGINNSSGDSPTQQQQQQSIHNFSGKKNGDLIKVNGQINNNNNNVNTPIIGGNQISITPQHQNRIHHQTIVPGEQNENDILQSPIRNSCGSSPESVSSCQKMSSFDKENRCLRNDAQNSINTSTYTQDDCQNNMSDCPHDSYSKGDRLGKKHRSGATSKSSKPRLKNMGSSSSMDGGNSTSGFISRDSSIEQFTDQTGVDLLQFFKETLNKNPKDRSTLLKIEKELVDLANDKIQHEITFPATSSYNRMLIHRVAAFFGMEHNVDSATQQCVIVARTKATRIPEIRFRSLLRDRLSDEPRKSILKRDSHSFEDPRQGFLIADRGLLDRKAKSFEEREEEYEKARRRIFRAREQQQQQQQHHQGGDGIGDEAYWHWSGSDSSEQSTRLRQNNKLLKVQSLSIDSRCDGRPSVSKSHSFGGYGGPPPCGGPLARGDSMNSTKSADPRLFSKQDSIGSNNTPWRLSPSSSGYKTQTQSLRSDSVTPSPTGYGSDDHTPEPSVAQSPPAASCGVVWAVTDMASVPRGSVLINPQTLQPIVNQDGTIYHFDPSNLPPSQAVAPGMYNNHNCNNNHKNIGTNMIRNNNRTENKRSSKSEQINSCDNSSGGQATTTSSTVTEGSIETLSESSSHTVLNAGNRDDSEDTSVELAKESHIHREMCDIQEEIVNSSSDGKNKIATKSDDTDDGGDQKPTLKNQATSPNIHSPEPIETSAQISEVAVNNGSSADSSEGSSSSNHASNSTSSSPSNVQENNKKDDAKTTSSNIPIMSYATNYQHADSGTVFPSQGNAPYPTTTYQQGPDGSVYAVPQQMVYTYPPPMDGEFQGYFMPVYEQPGQRDPNGLVPASAQAIFQPSGGTTAVVPVAYPTAPFGGSPLYQGQVVYSPEQFAPSASTPGQIQQYQMTYPVGYPYPYNGYWGQAMTYYLPQTLGNTVPSSLIPPPLPAAVTSNNTGNSTGISTKRNSPPQQGMSSGHSSQSTTPANTYQFAQSVPFALSTDPNGPTMYTIPQATVFPNMLPYGPPSTPSASAGVLTSITPHQPNAVISPLISHPSGPTGPPLPLDPSVAASYAVANAVNNGSHANNSGTPHSAPSTPLSNPLPLPHQQRNPPLFATPPIIPNGFNTHMHNHNFTDHSGSGSHSHMGYDKKNSNGGNGKKINGNYIPNGRQNNYMNNQQNQRKPNFGEISNISSSQNGISRQLHMTQQHKRMNSDKSQSGGGLMGSSNMSCNNTIQNSEKPRTGIRPKPGNLDLRRSASQRNSPSTNSIESNNNSPNSIASNHLSGGYSTEHPQSMYMTRGTHIPPMHPPTAAAVVAAAAAAVNDAAAACHQPLIGAYNHPPAAGMYIKYGQAYFPHPSVALPNNRRSPPNDLRPSLAPLTGVYPAVNMMLPAPRQMQPRHPNPNYKGNKPSR